MKNGRNIKLRGRKSFEHFYERRVDSERKTKGIIMFSVKNDIDQQKQLRVNFSNFT